MAIDPQSLQILGMVLDRQQREQEGEAYRGHQINMANINVAQRNLENQISMNFQRQQNTESQINNLQNTLMGMGIDTNRFGSDSQLGEMAEKISGSLVNKNKQLSELTDLQLEELQSLRDMGSAFTRGATVASKFQAKFDENFDLDPTSDFGAFNLAVGDESRMAELFEERGIDYGTDPRERHAFIQGASGAFSDISSALERERFKMEALAAKRRANNELLQEENLDLANFKARHELKDQIAFDPTPFITGDLMTLADPEVSSKDKEKIQNDIQQRLTSGADSFTKQLASKIGIDYENLLSIKESELTDEQKSIIKYFSDVQQSFQENSAKHINNLVSNRTAFTSSIQKSGKELEKALERYGSLDEAIRQGGIAASDVGNLLGFAGNPYLNDTIGGGFQALNEIMNVAKAQEELVENKNPSTAVQKATDAYNRETAIEIGEDLRTFISKNAFPETGSSDSGNEDGGGSGFLEGLFNGGNNNNNETEESGPTFEERFPENYDPERIPAVEGIKKAGFGLGLGLSTAAKATFDSVIFAADKTIEKIADIHQQGIQDRQRTVDYLKLKRISNQLKSGTLSDDEMVQAIEDFKETAAKIDPDSLSEFNKIRGYNFRQMVSEFKENMEN